MWRLELGTTTGDSAVQARLTGNIATALHSKRTAVALQGHCIAVQAHRREAGRQHLRQYHRPREPATPTQVMTEAAPWGLPSEVLVHVLQHVPLRDRLCSCALVQQSWRHAAAAATHSIQLQNSTPARCSQLLDWLPQHGQQVLHLDVQAANRQCCNTPLMQLPCPKLTSLKLQYVSTRLQEGPEGQDGMLAAC